MGDREFNIKMCNDRTVSNKLFSKILNYAPNSHLSGGYYIFGH